MPWFDRKVSSVFSAVRAEQTLSGWRALGGAGVVVLALALVAVVWAACVARTPWSAWRRRSPSALWLVLAGGLALVIVMSVTVDRVGRQLSDGDAPLTTTTTPSAGLAVAYGGALAIILVGLVVLVMETRARSQET